MPTEQELQQEYLRGKRAEDVLTNPEYQRAFAIVEDELIKRWKDPKYTPEDRERLWVCVQVLPELRKVLNAAVQNGRLAAKELDPIAKKKRFRVV